MNLVKLNWWHPRVRPDNSNDVSWNELIHPDDLELLVNTKFRSGIFVLKGSLGDFVEIEQLNWKIRVKEECLTPIKYEGFYLNDRVETISSPGRKNTNKIGIVNKIIYHYKDQMLNYYLCDMNGRDISKRYVSHDLRKIDN